MGKQILERYWKGDKSLRRNPVVSGVFECIRDDIRDGTVFPALRENEIHLYHEGGRILRIRPKSAYTHARYLDKCGQKEISLGIMGVDKYQEIKNHCKDHNTAQKTEHKETWIVSRLFGRFSAWSKHRAPSQPRLIDIEVRLRTGHRVSEMIDLLLIDDDGQLTFVEVKRQYDPRIRTTTGDPEVVEQVEGYESALRQGKSDVLEACGQPARVLARAFEMENPVPEPTRMFERVPILVCRRDTKHGRDTWLKEHLSLNAKGKIGKELVIDGGAINKHAYDGQEGPPWCKTGLWNQLDLATAFKEIRAQQT